MTLILSTKTRHRVCHLQMEWSFFFLLTVPPAFVYRYYNWSTAAPVMLAMQVYQKPLPQVKPTDALHFYENVPDYYYKFRNRLEYTSRFPNLNLERCFSLSKNKIKPLKDPTDVSDRGNRLLSGAKSWILSLRSGLVLM